jgi:hypothetical protein
MSIPATERSPLSAEQRDRLAALLPADTSSATDQLLMDFGQVIHDRRTHQHPKSEDLFCHNLAGWMGERAAYLLRRLVDLEEDNARLRGESTDLTPIPVHWDRLVMHPTGEDTDTIVCCQTESGHPVALFLSEEYREALGLQLVDPDPDAEADGPEFFQPGWTYTQTSNASSSLPPRVTWTFDVRSVEEAPDGQLTALGFLRGDHYGTGVWTPHGEYDLDGWTVVADEPEGDQD